MFETLNFSKLYVFKIRICLLFPWQEARQEEEQPTQDDDTDNPEEEDEDDDHDDDEDFAGRSAQTTPTLEPTQQSMSATEDEGDSTMSEPQVINATPTESAPPSTTPVTTNKRAEIKKRKKKVTRNRDSGDSEATLLKEVGLRNTVQSAMM